MRNYFFVVYLVSLGISLYYIAPVICFMLNILSLNGTIFVWKITKGGKMPGSHAFSIGFHWNHMTLRRAVSQNLLSSLCCLLRPHFWASSESECGYDGQKCCTWITCVPGHSLHMFLWLVACSNMSWMHNLPKVAVWKAPMMPKKV